MLKENIKIFSGIRPSGKLHLGNYLGAIKNWIDLQDKAEQAIFAVVDYHGITTPYDPQTYQKQIMDVVLDYLAAGVDPSKSLLVRQSKIQQHTELAWIFSTMTPVSWLDRLPTYKEQLEKTGANNLGLLDYPVLMAADILLYKSNLVPVGEDQMPHIDLTNEVAKRFNSTFGQTFEPVKPYLAEGARIMSLQDPTKKMSKTGDEGIALTDSPDAISEKIKRAVTDSGKEIKYDPENKPAISNLLTIFGLMSGKEIKTLEKEYKGKSYAEFKKDLADLLVEKLMPIQIAYKKTIKDENKLMKILEDGAKQARAVAQETMKEVKQKIGLL